LNELKVNNYAYADVDMQFRQGFKSLGSGREHDDVVFRHVIDEASVAEKACFK
jgi:hypothetical protein